jgi:sugar-specific transcriptional regulator TrmB
MDERLISQIEELGLSNKEARVYVANLMLGAAGVQQIADTSGIKRVTTYVILESLVSLGLVSQTSKAKKTLFNAEAPSNLSRLLEKREQSLRDQKTQLAELLPELDALKTLPKESPNVKFYDGAEGIKTVVKTFIAESKTAGVEELYGMSNLDQLYTFFPEIAQAQSNPDRVDAGIHSKIIYTSAKGALYAKSDAAKNREARFVKPDEYPINGDMAIVGDRIAMVSLTGPKPVGVIITNPELARTWTTLFMLAWAQADGLDRDSQHESA